MMQAIWPSYASNGTTAQGFLSFLIFWPASLPAVWFPVHKIRHLFTIKAYMVPTAGLALFVWAVYRADGMGPIIHQPATAHGPDLIWDVVGAIISSLANFVTINANNPRLHSLRT